MVSDKDAEQQLVTKALEVIHDDKRLAQLSSNIEQLAQHQSADRKDYREEIKKTI